VLARDYETEEATVSTHSRFRVEVDDPAVELEHVAKIEALLVQVDGELAQLMPCATRDALRHRLEVGRTHGLARIRSAAEKALKRQAGCHV
jgi:hypothetical protein